MVATRADVAQLAGVSPAIVSYVINDSRPVSERTRQAVLDAVSRLDYTPNPAARSLRSGVTKSLGLLLPEDGNPFFSELAAALEAAAFARGQVLLLGSAKGDARIQAQYLRTFVQRGVDGIVIISESLGSDSDSISEELPVVVLDRIESPGRISTVVADHHGGARLATGHLVEHGRQRVACVAGPTSVPSARLRVAGWRQALAEAGCAPDERLLQEAPLTLEGGYRAMIEIIERGSADAVFISSDIQAIGALRACAERGIRVPEDVAVASFDGTEIGRNVVPALTTIQQPIDAIAERTLTVLLDLIQSSPDRTETHDVLDVTLVRRESCGCRAIGTRS
ncbi:MAG: LacI family DNA-binding transcriptional regulator [Protaetiibacter sp.]